LEIAGEVETSSIDGTNRFEELQSRGPLIHKPKRAFVAKNRAKVTLQPNPENKESSRGVQIKEAAKGDAGKQIGTYDKDDDTENLLLLKPRRKKTPDIVALHKTLESFRDEEGVTDDGDIYQLGGKATPANIRLVENTLSAYNYKERNSKVQALFLL